MFIPVYMLNTLMFFNINFPYIKIQHTYTTILQRTVCILTIVLVHTMSPVYKSG